MGVPIDTGSCHFHPSVPWTATSEGWKNWGCPKHRHRDFIRVCLWKVRGLGLQLQDSLRKWAIIEEWEICMVRRKAGKGEGYWNYCTGWRVPWEAFSLVLIFPSAGLSLMDKLAPFFSWYSVLPFIKERKLDASQMAECICSSNTWYLTMMNYLG